MKSLTTNNKKEQDEIKNKVENAYDDGSEEYKEFLEGAIRSPKNRDEKAKRWMLLVNLEKWKPEKNYSKVMALKKSLIEKVDMLCRDDITLQEVADKGICRCTEKWKEEGKECRCGRQRLERVIFQIEGGKTDNLAHIHFYIDLVKAQTGEWLKAQFLEWLNLTIAPPQIVIKKKERQVIKYCEKVATRIVGAFHDTSKDYTAPGEEVKYNILQEYYLREIEKQTDRQILFVVDKMGRIGKSTLAENEVTLTSVGSTKRRRYSIYITSNFDKVTEIYKFVSSTLFQAQSKGENLRYEAPTIFIDLVREQNMPPRDIARLLEMLKKKVFIEPRNKAKTIVTMTPKLCVFTNKHIPGITSQKNEKGAPFKDCLLTTDRLQVLIMPTTLKGVKEQKGSRYEFVNVELGKVVVKELTDKGKKQRGVYL